MTLAAHHWGWRHDSEQRRHVTLSNTGNTFSGGINLNGGTVAVSSISDLGSGTNTLTFNNGGELLYTGANVAP